MLYVLCESEMGIYTLFHNETNSVFYGTKKEVKELKESTGEKIVNTSLYKEKPISLNRNMFLISIYEDGLCKVVMRTGRVRYIALGKVKEYIKEDRINNCKFNGGNIEYKGVTRYRIREKREQIRKDYRLYKTKCKLLGIDASFDYSIEGENVVLERYTGKSREVIIPEFITAIGEQAFADTGITSVTLPSQLKFIGGRAFKSTSIRGIFIPDSVRYIGDGVFALVENIEANREIKRKYKENIRTTFSYEKECYIDESTYSNFM